MVTHSHLVKVVGYQHLVYTPEREATAIELKTTHDGMRLCTIPSLEEMIQSTTKPYPFDTTFEKEENTKIVIMHSSGTTGIHLKHIVTEPFD